MCSSYYRRGTTNVHACILINPLCDVCVCLQAMWVPGSQTELVVVTDTFVKIYDLRVDLISPVYYFVILTGKIKDATVAVNGEVRTCTMYMYVHECMEHYRACRSSSSVVGVSD